MKRAHFSGQEARQVSLDDGPNRFFFCLFVCLFFFFMYKVCAKALNVFIVIPKMHDFLLYSQIRASVHLLGVPTRWQIRFTENRGKNSLGQK